jgi:hypothetical protein
MGSSCTTSVFGEHYTVTDCDFVRSVDTRQMKEHIGSVRFYETISPVIDSLHNALAPCRMRVTKLPATSYEVVSGRTQRWVTLQTRQREVKGFRC